MCGSGVVGLSEVWSDGGASSAEYPYLGIHSLEVSPASRTASSPYESLDMGSQRMWEVETCGVDESASLFEDAEQVVGRLCGRDDGSPARCRTFSRLASGILSKDLGGSLSVSCRDEDGIHVLTPNKYLGYESVQP